MLILRLPLTKNNFFFEFSAHENVLHALKIYYPYFELVNSYTLLNHDFSFIIDPQSCIVKNQTSVLTCIPIESEQQLFKTLVRLIRDNIILEKHAIFLHSATLLFHEKAVAFLAQSGMGKTTLSAFFIQDRVWKLLTEDMLILDFNTMEIHSARRPLLLRSTALHILQKYAPTLVFDYNPILDRYLPITDKSISNTPESFRLTHLAFLNRTTSSPLPIINILKTDATKDILYNAYCPYQVSRNIIGANLLNQKCLKYYIQYNDLALLKHEFEYTLQHELSL